MSGRSQAVARVTANHSDEHRTCGPPPERSPWRRWSRSPSAAQARLWPDGKPSYFFPSLSAMNTSFFGNFWNSEAGLLKLVASTSGGLPAIHSDRSISS